MWAAIPARQSKSPLLWIGIKLNPHRRDFGMIEEVWHVIVLYGARLYPRGFLGTVFSSLLFEDIYDMKIDFFHSGLLIQLTLTSMNVVPCYNANSPGLT